LRKKEKGSGTIRALRREGGGGGGGVRTTLNTTPCPREGERKGKGRPKIKEGLRTPKRLSLRGRERKKKKMSSVPSPGSYPRKKGKEGRGEKGDFRKKGETEAPQSKSGLRKEKKKSR